MRLSPWPKQRRGHLDVRMDYRADLISRRGQTGPHPYGKYDMQGNGQEHPRTNVRDHDRHPAGRRPIARALRHLPRGSHAGRAKVSTQLSMASDVGELSPPTSAMQTTSTLSECASSNSTRSPVNPPSSSSTGTCTLTLARPSTRKSAPPNAPTVTTRSWGRTSTSTATYLTESNKRKELWANCGSYGAEPLKPLALQPDSECITCTCLQCSSTTWRQQHSQNATF